MGELMQCIAGIRPEVLKKLVAYGETVLELISCSNVLSLREVPVTGQIFITDEPFELIRKGVEGIVAEVVEKKEYVTRADFLDEMEVEKVRIRVRYISKARVESVSGLSVTVRLPHPLVG